MPGSFPTITLGMKVNTKGLNKRKDGISHMATIITVSMLYFPFVIVGLGQTLIMGTTPTRRGLNDTTDVNAWGISPVTFDEKAQALGTAEKRCRVCLIPGCPVFAPR
jgi:hypothetical protein